MTTPTESRTELYLRFSHRSMVVVLLMILALGGMTLATVLWPEGAFSRWLAQASYVVPVATVVLFTALLTSMRRQGWRPDAPEMKAILSDEWRRANMDRARRVAFVVVLVAQLPLALLLAHLPSTRALVAMAVSTTTLGMAALAGAFLFYDRG